MKVWDEEEEGEVRKRSINWADFFLYSEQKTWQPKSPGWMELKDGLYSFTYLINKHPSGSC